MSVRRLAPKELQPASFAFTEENLAWAKAQIAKFPPGRQASAVIPILWRVQEQHDGWVSEAAIRAVADLLQMPYIRALEIATFYTMFQLQPVGRKAHVQVCGTTPCRLRGAEELLDVCQHRIHHEPFHRSADGDFSWEEVECLGACVNAPMVLIWSDTYEDLTRESFGKLLDGFASGNPPKPGPQIDRQFSAPAGGLTTLKNGAGGVTGTSGTPKEPVLADAEPKKPGAAANVQERPAPKPPADDATRKDPP
jgi:NADH-quinone oxidoreductase subunit E